MPEGSPGAGWDLRRLFSPGAQAHEGREDPRTEPHAPAHAAPGNPSPITLEDMSDQEGAGSASHPEATLTHPCVCRALARGDRRSEQVEKRSLSMRRNPIRHAFVMRLQVLVLALASNLCDCYQVQLLPRTTSTRTGLLRLSSDDQQQPEPSTTSVQPFTQAGVPEDQQPAQEFREMKLQAFFDWAELDDNDYFTRIASLVVALSLVLGTPITMSTFSSMLSPEALLSALVGGAIPTLLFALRLRTGWGYISTRLADKQVYYEMKQRGFLVEKDAESVMRDRLLNEYEVLPVLKRVDTSIGVVSGLLAACIVGIFILGGSGATDPNEQPSPSQPAFCQSRFTYFKAIAGGSSCD